jgi:hypothetical protein
METKPEENSDDKSDEVLSDETTSIESLGSDEEEQAYKALLNDIPVGLVVYKLVNPADADSLQIIYTNAMAEVFL